MDGSSAEYIANILTQRDVVKHKKIRSQCQTKNRQEEIQTIGKLELDFRIYKHMTGVYLKGACKIQVIKDKTGRDLLENSFHYYF